MDTLLLDRSGWDLALDAAGNMAVASEPYAWEQDVASECRVYLGECYYDTTIGVPYRDILGRPVPIAILKESLIAAARRVPGVNNPRVFLTEIGERSLGGQVQFGDRVVGLGPEVLSGRDSPMPKTTAPSADPTTLPGPGPAVIGHGALDFSTPDDSALLVILEDI